MPILDLSEIQVSLSSARVVGRITAGAGAPEELTGAQITPLLSLASTTDKGLAPASGGGTTNFLRADLTWAAPPGGGATTLTGDVTGSGTGSFATTLATVNSNTGTFGGASTVPQISVNGKGLITGVAAVAIGNAGTATALQTARTISITGKATSAGGAFDGTGNLALNVTALTVDGAITPTSVASTGAVTSSGTGGVGYATGAGGAVTQATNKSTAVTLNKTTGEITMNGAALAAGAVVTFVFNNSTLVAGDMIVTSHHSGGTVGPYLINARVTGAGAGSVAVRNTSAGSLSEAIVIKFAVIKAANS